MKQYFLMMAAIVTVSIAVAQDSPTVEGTGLPGDNFSLTGALELFRKAGSPEEFEKLLNTEANDVNNLDLNEDGEIDYIKVVDKLEGNAHALILQAVISETESQDIAVIELEKTGEKMATVQIVGDADIFGEETIVEPGDEDNGTAMAPTGARFEHGPAAGYHSNAVGSILVNVWLWPSVQFVYAPAYRVWYSPWAWRSRPIWWHPWRPIRYSVFYQRRVHYAPRYVVVHQHRLMAAHRIYTPLRVTSVTVRTRNQASVTRYRSSRTVVSGKNGTVRRNTTTVQGPRGRKATRTTTTVRKRRR